MQERGVDSPGTDNDMGQEKERAAGRKGGITWEQMTDEQKQSYQRLVQEAGVEVGDE